MGELDADQTVRPTDLIGWAKPPCLYPLPDGRRCAECAACHPTLEEMAAHHGVQLATAATGGSDA